MYKGATNNKNLHYSKIALLGFFLIWLAVALFTCNAKAELAPYPLENESYALSLTDELDGEYKADGSPYTVTDYIKDVKSHALDLDSDLHTRLIRKIIPYRAFINTGEYLHKGKTYSYYINTFDKTDKYLYASEVVLILYNLEIDTVAKRAISGIKVFSNGYYTGVSSGGKITTYCNGFFPNEYYLRDIQFDCLLKNVNEPNYGDADYVKANDTGTVIRHARMNFKGVKECKSGSNLFVASSTCVMDALFAFVPDLSDARVIYKGLKSFKAWSESFIGCLEASDRTIVESNGEQYIQDLPPKEDQEDNGQPYLRHASAAFKNNEEILIDDYMKFIILPQDGKPETKVIFDISYNIFVHPNSGKDYILLSSGKTKTYTKECSDSAQFKQRCEDIMFKGR